MDETRARKQLVQLAHEEQRPGLIQEKHPAAGAAQQLREERSKVATEQLAQLLRPCGGANATSGATV